MCHIIFEDKAVVQDQYPLSLNPAQKAGNPIQDRYRSIGPLKCFKIFEFIEKKEQNNNFIVQLPHMNHFTIYNLLILVVKHFLYLIVTKL